MPKRAFNVNSLGDPGARGYSHGVRMGNLLFLAGQTGNHPEKKLVPGDFAAQVRQVFANMQAVLEAEGGSLDNLVTMTVYITDMRFGDEFCRLRAEILKRDFPASALIGVSQLAPHHGLLEIQAIAAFD